MSRIRNFPFHAEIGKHSIQKIDLDNVRYDLEPSDNNMKNENNNFNSKILLDNKDLANRNVSRKIAKHYTKQQVFLYKTSINIIDCIFSRCSSNSNPNVPSGGAIFISCTSDIIAKVTITRTGFQLCTSHNEGGALFAQSSDIKLYKTCFTQCYSQTGQTITIISGSKGYNCTISQSNIASNSNLNEECSKTIGITSANNVIFSSSNISHNSVDGESAGAYVYSKHIDFDTVYLSNNTGQSVISIFSTEIAKFSQCAIINCQATNNIFSLQYLLLLDLSAIINNVGKLANDFGLVIGTESSTNLTKANLVIKNIIQHPGLNSNATFWCWARGGNSYNYKTPEPIGSLPPIHIVGSFISIIIIIVCIRLLIVMHNIRVDRARTIAGIPEAYLIEGVSFD